SPLPSSTKTLLEPLLATTMSGLPSPLRSAIATDHGIEPAATPVAPWNVPSPLPSSTARLLEPESATARSSLPSPLRSATATDAGGDHEGVRIEGARDAQ